MLRVRFATIVTGSTVMALSATLVYWSWLEMQRATDIDGAEVQGALLLSVVLGLVVFTVCALFPVVAMRLESRGRLTRRRWTQGVFLGVFLLASLASIAVGLADRDLMGGLTVLLPFFLLPLLLSAPLSFLWCRLARIPD